MSDLYGLNKAEPEPLAPTGQRVRMVQIIAGHWSTDDGIDSYSVIGLSTVGDVYRYDATNCGWVPWSMDVLKPRTKR